LLVSDTPSTDHLTQMSNKEMSTEEKWAACFDISVKQWNEKKDKAMKVWDDLKDIDKNEESGGYESHTCPMKPFTFFHLSMVSGFNKMNGDTYEEYVNKWRERTGKVL
jgi:hypothetical protein